ncbi:NfeD family protein [Dyadobacter luteus]|jgi:membrane protein implicated in regulation of membrane protease activity|uniref:NfeD family protein n=1 Tax=Dyadobacter luteus TaxID=2259619 RepID=A0A3D8Y6E4_9BACT|nr:NfeD family protein [Dyadobacter luteus]REA58366.1 NfeD family protein [Dyadobacter luteus]
MDLSLAQIWLIIGLVMLLAELVSVLLVFIFFAIGALLTALLASFGILPDIETQIIAFSAISIISMLILRKQARKLLDNRGKHHEYNEFVGETALVIRDIPVSGQGKIYYRGAEWKAISSDNEIITAGSKVVIKQTDGIVLIVEESI